MARSVHNPGRVIALVVAVVCLVTLVVSIPRNRGDHRAATGDRRTPSAGTSTTSAQTTEQDRPSTDPSPQEPWPRFETYVITPDGQDSYTEVPAPGGVRVVSSGKNTDTNLRVLFADKTARASTDQISCSTWHGVIDDFVQPGVMVRYTDPVDGPVRAVTVTNNIFLGLRGQWNVHVWDASIEGDLPATSIGRFFIPAAYDLEGNLLDRPWTMCVRVRRTLLEFKLWSAGSPEPAWQDSRHTASMKLPESAVFAGRPGFYLGHQSPGAESQFTDVHSTNLDPTVETTTGEPSDG